MPENKRNNEKEFLDLLKLNYKNLHKSVWEAHKISWAMTGIFIPIIFAVFGYFIKHFDKFSFPQTIIGSFVLMGVIWFWFGMIAILYRFNLSRFEQLEKIEHSFNNRFSTLLKEKAEFKQYTLNYKKIRQKEICEKLQKLSREIEFPDTFKNRIEYNPDKQILIFKGIMTKEERDKLMGLSTDLLYQKAVKKLFNKSNKWTLRLSVYLMCQSFLDIALSFSIFLTVVLVAIILIKIGQFLL